MKKNVETTKNVKVTIDNIINAALERQKKVKTPLTLYIPELGGAVDFKRMTNAEKSDIIDQLNRGAINYGTGNKIVVYNACELFKQREIYEALGLDFDKIDPVDIVDHIFSYQRIAEIGELIMNDGEGKSDIEEIKN